VKLREAARALVVTPAADVLLVHFVFPWGACWVLPGGGIEPGESVLQALIRELHEETGLVGVDPGPRLYVHERRYIGPGPGDHAGQRDIVHLVEVPARFEPAPAILEAGLRAEHVTEVRWFRAEELADLPLMPSMLPEILADWRAGERAIRHIALGEADRPSRP
jgi:8-oxo-dGTP pyrophosphatase MutT (NUDIX family)